VVFVQFFCGCCLTEKGAHLSSSPAPRTKSSLPVFCSSFEELATVETLHMPDVVTAAHCSQVFATRLMYVGNGLRYLCESLMRSWAASVPSFEACWRGSCPPRCCSQLCHTMSSIRIVKKPLCNCQLYLLSCCRIIGRSVCSCLLCISTQRYGRC
jgi:hypothetical protein